MFAPLALLYRRMRDLPGLSELFDRVWDDPLRHDAVLMLGLQTLYKLSGIVLVMVLSRTLSSEKIGIYFFALSFAGSLVLLTGYHINQVMIRKIAAEPHNAEGWFSSLLGFRLVSSPFYLLCVVSAALIFARDVWQVVMVVAVYILFENLHFCFVSFFVAMKKVVYNVVLGGFTELLFLAAFLWAMWMAPSLETLLLVNFLRSVLLLVAAVAVTQRSLCRLRVSWHSSYLREGGPFFLVTLFDRLRGQLAVILLGFLADYQAVGVYQLAFGVLLGLLFIPETVGLVTFPRLAAMVSPQQKRRDLIQGSVFLLAAGFVLTILVLLAAEPLTGLLYGRQAGAVRPLLRMMAPLFPLVFLNSFLYSALMATHHEKKALLVSAIALMTGVSGSWTLIPYYGAYGLIYTQWFTSVIQLGLLGWNTRRGFFRDGDRGTAGREVLR